MPRLLRGAGFVGFEPQCLVEVADGVVVGAPVVVSAAAADVELRAPRPQFDGPVEVGDGLLVLPPHVEGDAAKVERLGVVGLFGQRGGQIVRRAFPIACVHALPPAGAGVEGADVVLSAEEEPE